MIGAGATCLYGSVYGAGGAACPLAYGAAEGMFKSKTVSRPTEAHNVRTKIVADALLYEATGICTVATVGSFGLATAACLPALAAATKATAVAYAKTPPETPEAKQARIQKEADAIALHKAWQDQRDDAKRRNLQPFYDPQTSTWYDPQTASYYDPQSNTYYDAETKTVSQGKPLPKPPGSFPISLPYK